MTQPLGKHHLTAEKKKTNYEYKITTTMKILLEHYGITAHELSKRSNVPYSTVYYMLTKNGYTPTLSTLSAVSKYFGITIDQLLGDSPLDDIINPTIDLSDNYKKYINEKRLEKQQWDYTLYLDCVNLLIKYLRRKCRARNITMPRVNFYQATAIVNEIYKYSYSKNLPTPHADFTEWFIETSLESFEE